MRPLTALPAVTLPVAALCVLITAAPAGAETLEPVVPRGLAVRPPAAAPARTTLTSAQLTAAMAKSLTRTATTSRLLGPRLSGVVLDARTGRVVWSTRTGTTRMPASAQKLVTALTVLRTVPADRVLTTSVCVSASRPGTVWLRGGGDPSLTAARLRVLAAGAAVALRPTPPTPPTPSSTPTPSPSPSPSSSAPPTEPPSQPLAVQLDQSIFPDPVPAIGWRPRYLRGDVQLVRGLTLAGYRGPDGRAAAGKVFVTALTAAGAPAQIAGTTPAPADCRDVATTASAPVSSLVADMLAYSDNDFAEFLLRHAARTTGRTAYWSTSLALERSLLARAGVPAAGLRLYDGSGLSRANRMPVATLAAVIRVLRADPVAGPVVFAPGALPIAGVSGTLIDRFQTPQHRCAIGRVQAKTGTLGDALALAGVARGVDGRDRVFVFLVNGVVSLRSTRLAVDTLATTTVGCRLG